MSRDHKEKQIENLLENMPSLEDHQHKEALYEKIVHRMQAEQPMKKQKRLYLWLLPSIASALALFLLIAMSPDFFETELNESAKESQMVTEDKGESIQQGSSRDIEEGRMESAGMLDETETKLEESNSLSTFKPSAAEKVITQAQQNQIIITTAVPDKQGYYLIPLSFVFPFAAEKGENYYNTFSGYLREEDWGLGTFPLENWEYQLGRGKQHVTVHIPAGFQMPDTKTDQREMATILSYMFFSETDPEVFLEKDGGQNSELKRLEDQLATWPSNQKKSYKYYQYENNRPRFLVPVPMGEDMSVKQALEEMKKNEPGFHVHASIPAEVEIDINTTNEQLTVILTGKEVNRNNLETKHMLEAILMTAKSFGYRFVSFDLPIDQVGPYQMKKPIPVPLAANPLFTE